VYNPQVQGGYFVCSAQARYFTSFWQGLYLR